MLPSAASEASKGFVFSTVLIDGTCSPICALHPARLACLASGVEREGVCSRHAFTTATVADFYRKCAREKAAEERNGTHLAPRGSPKCQVACSPRVPLSLQQEYCDDRGIKLAAQSGISVTEMQDEIIASAESAAALSSPRRFDSSSQGGRKPPGRSSYGDRRGEDDRPRYFRHNSLDAADFRNVRGAFSTPRPQVKTCKDEDEELLRAMALSQAVEPPLFWVEK
jgi:hypothetical protein